jgi:hypothetical protein
MTLCDKFNRYKVQRKALSGPQLMQGHSKILFHNGKWASTLFTRLVSTVPISHRPPSQKRNVRSDAFWIAKGINFSCCKCVNTVCMERAPSAHCTSTRYTVDSYTLRTYILHIIGNGNEDSKLITNNLFNRPFLNLICLRYKKIIILFNLLFIY